MIIGEADLGLLYASSHPLEIIDRIVVKPGGIMQMFIERSRLARIDRRKLRVIIFRKMYGEYFNIPYERLGVSWQLSKEMLEVGLYYIPTFEPIVWYDAFYQGSHEYNSVEKEIINIRNPRTSEYLLDTQSSL